MVESSQQSLLQSWFSRATAPDFQRASFVDHGETWSQPVECLFSTAINRLSVLDRYQAESCRETTHFSITNFDFRMLSNLKRRSYGWQRKGPKKRWRSMTVVVDNGVLCITEQQQGRPCGLPVVADVKLQPVKETTEDDYHEDADGTATEVRQLSSVGNASPSPSSRLEEKLPLHEALREFAVESLFCDNALLEKNIQRLVDEFPESVTAFDSKGYTPLHIACKEGAPLNVIHTLVGAWPDSVKWPTFNKEKMLPRRYYSGRNLQKSQVILFLLRTYSAAVEMTTHSR